MIDVNKSLAIIAVTAVVTALIRFSPFLIFHKGTPKPILYLGKVLPHAVMGNGCHRSCAGCGYVYRGHSLHRTHDPAANFLAQVPAG